MLVPDCLDNTGKPNKGVILRKSADYIRMLLEQNFKLQEELRKAGIQPPPMPPSSSDLLPPSTGST